MAGADGGTSPPGTKGSTLSARFRFTFATVPSIFLASTQPAASRCSRMISTSASRLGPFVVATNPHTTTVGRPMSTIVRAAHPVRSSPATTTAVD